MIEKEAGGLPLVAASVEAATHRALPVVKAYAVTDVNEGTGGIVFAAHNIVARRLGANEYGDGEIGDFNCRRDKWADSFAASGTVPAAAMVGQRWHFECHGCGRRIDEDLTYEDGFEGWTTYDVVGSQNSAIYCRASCQTSHEAFEAERRQRQDRMIQRFERLVRRRFPGVVMTEKRPGCVSPHRAYVTRDRGRWVVEQVAVSFDFPGMRLGPAMLRYDRREGLERKPYYTCCNGDRDAFQAYAKETSPNAKAACATDASPMPGTHSKNLSPKEGGSDG